MPASRGKLVRGAEAAPFDLVITNRQRTCSVRLRLLYRIARTLLNEHLEIRTCSLAVHLVSAREIARLNECFLKHAGPTDVIAFDYGRYPIERPSMDEPPADAAPELHGEIFICVEEALKHARRFKTTWQSELVRYLIHGLLHLTGFDDQTQAERRKMKRREDQLLTRIKTRFGLRKLGSLS